MPDPHTYDETELLQRLARGEEQAFTVIYHRYQRELARYALNLTHSPDEARDIVHELFISLWKRRTEIAVALGLRAYLYGSIRHLSARYIEKNIRKHQFLNGLSAVFVPGPATAPTERLEVKELQQQVAVVVAAMPAKMQEVYLLSREQQLSHREIADRLGIAESTVKKQVQNALKLLKEELGDLSVLAALFLHHW